MIYYDILFLWYDSCDMCFMCALLYKWLQMFFFHCKLIIRYDSVVLPLLSFWLLLWGLAYQLAVGGKRIQLQDVVEIAQYWYQCQEGNVREESGRTRATTDHLCFGWRVSVFLSCLLKLTWLPVILEHLLALKFENMNLNTEYVIRIIYHQVSSSRLSSYTTSDMRHVMFAGIDVFPYVCRDSGIS